MNRTSIQRLARATAVTALPLVAAVLVVACGQFRSADNEATSSTMITAELGGETTRAEASRNSFGLPAPGLTNEERRRFESGDSFFTKNWVTAPASTDARDGLGPVFNAQACSSCHLLDGRGAPPDPDGGDTNLGLLFRLSLPGEDEVGGPLSDPTYGGQLQDRSILDVASEGSMNIEYEIIEGRYGDGTPFTLRAPSYSISDWAFGQPDADLMISPRLAPQVVGMGLLEAVPAATIEANADPEDADGDGISGRVNMVWDSRLGKLALGRFGWKANVATVEQQVAGAFHGDIGITSVLHPDENCTPTQSGCASAPNGSDPGGELELTEDRLHSVTFYSQTLAVPAFRGIGDPDVLEGFAVFNDFGCSSCHLTTLETGESTIEVLADQTIHPFTDLLLHDMGEGLADGRPDFGATGVEWRTPPLWGIGLIDDVNGGRFLLHDGRAATLEEAILWHGGEAEAAKDQFRLADETTRNQLLLFLEGL